MLQQVSRQGIDGSHSQLPSMQYRFTSFATSAPIQAAEFVEKYFGAVILPSQSFLTHRDVSPNATVRGVRFYYSNGSEFHDVYFISDKTKPSGSMSVERYEDYLHGLHNFQVEETWDWYMDWHLCLQLADLDLIAYRLVRDGVPIVTRSSYSFYVEIPFGITFQFLGSKLDLVWSELFNFCRYTNGHGERQKNFKIGTIPDQLPPIPELAPSHHSYFSNVPDEAFNFTLKHTSGKAFDMDGVWKESHRYSDGRCALLRWIQYPGYQVHFVDQFRKYEGNMSTQEMENYMANLHGNMIRKDAYFDFRIGFSVQSLEPFEHSLDAAYGGQNLYLRQNESGQQVLYMKIPAGWIFELVSEPPVVGI